MQLIRKQTIQDLLGRIEHRTALLTVKCADLLTRRNQLAPTLAEDFAGRSVGLVQRLRTVDDETWQAEAVALGSWCAEQQIPFNVVMAQQHYYRQVSMPLIVREYQGLEGYLEGHLALDEGLTALISQIPLGYFGQV